jgi:hypothetical protein
MALILFFGERLGLAFGPDREIASFVADGVRYENAGGGYLTSHYDRLVDGDDRLIGIQLWCYPAHAELARSLAELGPREYLDPSLADRGTPAYGVYFDGRVDPGAGSTGDQAFGGEIFLSRDGALAVSIDPDYLFGGTPTEAADLAVVRSAPVWRPELTEVVEAVVPEA